MPTQDDIDELELASIKALKNEKQNAIAQLVPTLSDKEAAENIRRNLVDVYKPILEILTDAKKQGFNVGISTGADGFGIVRLMAIQITKDF